MAYEDALVRRDWLDSSGVYKRYGTKTNAFGATGASEKRLAVCNMATSYNHERPTSGHLAPVEDFRGLGSMSPILQGEEYRGIEFQDAMRECQPDATNSRSDNPWSPWHPLGFHEVTEDQRMFAPHEESYGQPCPFQLRLESSFESALNQFDGDDSGYAESPTEVSDQPTHSNTSNVLGYQRGQQYLPTPSNGLMYSWPGGTTSVSSPQQERQLNCPELGCRSKFKGTYAHGNLARHRRLKHGGQEVREYICEEPGCSKSYKRQDARVKHYRKHHVHLASVPILPRKNRSMSSCNGRSISLSM